jgi:hypothetical protein
MAMALLIHYKTTSSDSNSSNNAIGEISESLGTFLYSYLLAGQSYGYPMHTMCELKTREIADAALQCFKLSVAIFDESTVNIDKNDDTPWAMGRSVDDWEGANNWFYCAYYGSASIE